MNIAERDSLSGEHVHHGYAFGVKLFINADRPGITIRCYNKASDMYFLHDAKTPEDGPVADFIEDVSIAVEYAADSLEGIRVALNRERGCIA